MLERSGAKMTTEFKNPCSRCGMCCIAEVCPIGQAHYGIGKRDKCPALSFDGAVSSCALRDLVPFGDGCCIKARAYQNGICYNFADLSPSMKQLAVSQIK